MNYIKTVAHIELFMGDKMRKVPFSNGYRPLFDFNNTETKISGSINLINRSSFEPGAIGEVQITFIKGIIDDSYFTAGSEFTFSEGANVLGKGQITSISSDSKT